MTRVCQIGTAILLICQPVWSDPPSAPPSTGPKPETVQAFNRYIRTTEAHLNARLQGEDDFIVADTPEIRRRLHRGMVVCVPRNVKGELKVDGGLIHDWAGAVFIPDVTLKEALNLIQDYDNHRKIYPHEVMRSRTLQRNGDDFKVYMRMLKRKVITVVLDTEHDAHYWPLTEHCWRSWSYSTRIVEVLNAGGSSERVQPPGRDHGFLWRLNSYWTFREKDGGVYIECEAISLTRSVPRGFGWLLDPIVRSLPEEALNNTLQATHDALRKARAASAPRQSERQ